jgi:hypothetical protein
MVRKAIEEYSCQNRWDIKLPVNDLTRIKENSMVVLRRMVPGMNVHGTCGHLLTARPNAGESRGSRVSTLAAESGR